MSIIGAVSGDPSAVERVGDPVYDLRQVMNSLGREIVDLIMDCIKKCDLIKKD